jgi:hypothetical protein
MLHNTAGEVYKYCQQMPRLEREGEAKLLKDGTTPSSAQRNLPDRHGVGRRRVGHAPEAGVDLGAAAGTGLNSSGQPADIPEVDSFVS